MVDVIQGNLQGKPDQSVKWDWLYDIMAQRTSEEEGDYIIRDFKIKKLEYVNSKNVDGLFDADENGNYRFWTISPGAYLARPDIGRWRPKHIHLSVSGGSARLVTQMYFSNEPNNASDPMALLMGDRFESNIGKPYETLDVDVDEGYRFDIVVGGRNATFFE